MKILFLSFYYSPDLCAGSFRSTALVEKLREKNVNIEIVTTQPNRYSTYLKNGEKYEKQGNVTITRVPLPNHNSGMLDQIKAFMCYAISVIKHTKGRDYDLVFATSSRLFTAFLGAYIAKRKRLPLYLDIRDIFVDTIKDVLPKPMATLLKPILSLVEDFSFNQAQNINLVSKGFEDYFVKRYPDANYSFFPNGIDKEFLYGDDIPVSTVSTVSTVCQKDPITVLYAGNIGEGQGLHKIIPALATSSVGKIHFRVIGSGGREKALRLATKGMTNVEISNPVDRQELVALYRKADVLFLHLNDYQAFEKVLPSKVFEYAATGKPILAGVSGYAARFIDEEVENANVFSPTDVTDALSKFYSLALNRTDRTEFNKKYSRDVIMAEMASDIFKASSESVK